MVRTCSYLTAKGVLMFNGQRCRAGEMGMMSDGRNAVHEVQAYRKLVLVYEALDAEIDKLIMDHGGHSEDMPPAALVRYRELAHRRDELQNEMRLMEQTLLNEG
jgi:hypothetical protein